MAQNRQLQLASDVERALAEYMGVTIFDAPEFPNLAEAFAKVVSYSHINGGMVSPRDVSQNARDLLDAVAQFQQCLAALVE